MSDLEKKLERELAKREIAHKQKEIAKLDRQIARLQRAKQAYEDEITELKRKADR